MNFFPIFASSPKSIRKRQLRHKTIKPVKTKYYLAACVMLRNEAPYIEEWIKYHSFLGFDRFFIYENDSIDNTYDLIKSWNRPDIDLKQIHGRRLQFRMYDKCLEDHKRDTRWLAFIDCDEFVTPRFKKVNEFLRDFESYAALCIHWRFFGSNGELVYRAAPVVERFTRCDKKVNNFVKSIVYPQETTGHCCSHVFQHTNISVDEHRKPLPPCLSVPENGTCDLIQLNHYFTKSKGECLQRRADIQVHTLELKDKPINQFTHHNRNDIEDLTALNWWRKI